ncbi:MAG TPA: hypothetical protein VFF69_16130 [Phycisphaerales bacterium]|nr:hypothetical protein [Phycisphaerales bacterium]
MGFNRVAMTVVVLAGAGVAMADITPVGEFMGDMTEGFENVLPPGGYAGPIDIFEGNVSMDDTLAHFVVISFIWSGPGGEVLPYNGNLFGGTVAGSTLFTFDTPVSDFGGYFTTVGAVPGGSVVFRDAAGGEIGTLPVEITPAEWAWQGWHSDTPVSSIEVIGGSVPVASVQYDDLQLNFVPAPSAMTLAVIGAGLSLRRRR